MASGGLEGLMASRRKIIEEKWLEFKNITLAKESPKAHVERARAVFFCGAAAMLKIIQDASIGDATLIIEGLFIEFDEEMKAYELKGKL
jgi:hypothetical protein